MSNSESIQWPKKSREFHNYVMDSTRWNDFEHRDNDIVVATWAKSGTTWIQQIVGQLLFDGAEDLPVMDICPWLDFRVIPKNEIFETLANQRHKRFIKTHLPADAMATDPAVQYIFVGRDGRDALWRWHHHHSQLTDQAYLAFNETPGLVGYPIPRPNPNIVEYFREWLAKDGYPVWPFFSNIRSWWGIRNLPNVLFVHFNELKSDLPEQMRRIAEFLGISIDEATWPKQVEHCTFAYMKDHAEALTPMLEQVFQGGGKEFINKGTNSRWRDVLSAEDVHNYEITVLRELGPECAKWLATGEMN